MEGKVEAVIKDFLMLLRASQIYVLIWLRPKIMNIIERFRHCKGSNFIIQILAWFGYFLLLMKGSRVLFIIWLKKLMSCLRPDFNKNRGGAVDSHFCQTLKVPTTAHAFVVCRNV